MSRYSPVWRPLTHTNPEIDSKQLVAGFLLFSVGFGLERMEPREFHRGELDVPDDKLAMTDEEEQKLEQQAKDTKALTTILDPPEYYSRAPCRVVARIHQVLALRVILFSSSYYFIFQFLCADNKYTVPPPPSLVFLFLIFLYDLYL